MKKEYQKAEINVFELELESTILDGSATIKSSDTSYSEKNAAEFGDPNDY